MEKFTVAIKFEADVSENAADELEYLVEEFVQGVANVVANDEFDQVMAQMASTVPASMLENNFTVCDEGSDAPIVADSNSI